MQIQWVAGKYHPHEPARAEALAGAELASFGARAAAFAIDFLVVLLLYAPVELARQYLVQRWHGVADIHLDAHFDFHEIGNVIALVVYFGLLAYWWSGQTIGKRLLRIRAVSLIGDRITLWQSVERALGYGASMLEGGFGFVQYFLHGNHCCVHDRIAETIVVKEPRSVKVNATPQENETPQSEIEDANIEA
jgi:uncharacterized RDD family membrane protein YckC